MTAFGHKGDHPEPNAARFKQISDQYPSRKVKVEPKEEEEGISTPGDDPMDRDFGDGGSEDAKAERASLDDTDDNGISGTELRGQVIDYLSKQAVIDLQKEGEEPTTF